MSDYAAEQACIAEIERLKAKESDARHARAACIDITCCATLEKAQEIAGRAVHRIMPYGKGKSDCGGPRAAGGGDAGPGELSAGPTGTATAGIEAGPQSPSAIIARGFSILLLVAFVLFAAAKVGEWVWEDGALGVVVLLGALAATILAHVIGEWTLS